MNSPLPDPSALEAGVIEDPRPSRPPRVHENVRDLLRTSVFGYLASSPTMATPDPPLRSVTYRPPTPFMPSAGQVEMRQSDLPDRAPDVLIALSGTISFEAADEFWRSPEDQQNRAQQRSQLSVLYDTRAVSALGHADISDPSLTGLTRQKAQQLQTPRRKKPKRPRKFLRRFAASQGMLGLLPSLLLAALVATYIVMGATESHLSVTFHILFVLGICMTTILFAHSMIRLFTIGKSKHNRPLFGAVSRERCLGRQRRHHHDRRLPETEPTSTFSLDCEAFAPPVPIPVHISSDDVRQDLNEARPQAANAIENAEDWKTDVDNILNPPPTYGRWLESVRADPDLLHWHAVSSNSVRSTSTLSFPTYGETVAVAVRSESPPGYATRVSLSQQEEVQNVRAGLAQERTQEPEVFVVRAGGVGLVV